MALADIFQLVHNHTLFGVPMVNVYHAVRENSGEQAINITDSFANSVLPIIRLYQSEDVVNNDLVAFNLDEETDFFTQSLLSAPGFRAGLDSPTFLAGGVRFPSLNRKVRSGQKRFAGALETDYANGVLDGPSTGLLEDIADALIGNWLDSGDSHHVANFIILKRVCDEVDPVTGKCLKYRLPELDIELVFYQPTVGLVKPDITSQVSRKTF